MVVRNLTSTAQNKSQCKSLRFCALRSISSCALTLTRISKLCRALFGENQSTNKDVLEALASNGNEMAACVYKFRALSRELKREVKRMDQAEKGFRTNDYFGNLARERRTEMSAQGTSSAGQVAVAHGEPLLLIDASAYIFRSYHALPPLHHSDGTPTGALHGMVKMLQRLLLGRLFRGERPRVVLVFDSKGPNFRHELYPEVCLHILHRRCLSSD